MGVEAEGDWIEIDGEGRFPVEKWEVTAGAIKKLICRSFMPVEERPGSRITVNARYLVDGEERSVELNLETID